MTLTTALIIIGCLFIAYLLDGYIRRKLYVTEVNLAKLRAKKELGAQPHATVGSKAWIEMIQVNNFRYGIVGNFDYDIRPTDIYELSGTQTFIATGVVLDKKRITKEEIVDDMASFAQTGKKFVADDKELRDRHIVVMYIQSNMKEFIWDNKGLYDNIEKGESVSISYNEKGPLSVGYKLKGERNDDSNPKRELDMGNNQKVS